MMTPDSPAAGSAATGEQRQRERRAAKPKTAAKGQPKETRGEEIIHELFRLAKVDLRASDHGIKLARELASLIGGK